MRVLFVSYSFPGPLAPMAAWLASQPDYKVIFATSRFRQDHPLNNVQRVVLKKYQGKGLEEQNYLNLWEEAIRAGKCAASSFETVRQSGYVPDIVMNASSNGVALGVRQVFPHAFRINFLEENNFDRAGQAAMRVKLQCLQMLEADMVFAFSEQCRDSYPPEFWPNIGIAPRMADTMLFSPDLARPFQGGKFSSGPGVMLAVFCDGKEKDCLALCLHILAERPRSKIVLILPNSFILRKYNDLNLPEAASRLEILAAPRQDLLRDIICASTLAVFPDSTRGILNAMSCGAPVLAACDLANIDRKILLPLKGGSPAEQAQCVLKILGQKSRLAKIGQEARNFVINNFGANTLMPEFFAGILEEYGQWRERKAG